MSKVLTPEEVEWCQEAQPPSSPHAWPAAMRSVRDLAFSHEALRAERDAAVAKVASWDRLDFGFWPGEQWERFLLLRERAEKAEAERDSWKTMYEASLKHRVELEDEAEIAEKYRDELRARDVALSSRLREAEMLLPKVGPQGVQLGNAWVSFDALVGWRGDDGDARVHFYHSSVIAEGVMLWASELRAFLAGSADESKKNSQNLATQTEPAQGSTSSEAARSAGCSSSSGAGVCGKCYGRGLINLNTSAVQVCSLCDGTGLSSEVK